MKSLEQVFTETCEKKGLSGEQIIEATKTCKTVEEKISAVERFDPNPFTRHNRRIERKNGSGSVVTESDKDERISRTAKEMRVSIREATIICGYDDPGPNVSESDAVLVQRAERWKRYAPFLTEAEANKLAQMGKEPE